MDALDHFNLPVSGLRNGLHEYNFSIENDFFAHFPESLVTEAAVAVKLSFDKHPDFYVMDFEFKGKVKTTCDRCLEEFNLPIEDSQSLMVKFDEKEEEDADVIYILKGTQQLNVARYIYEFINLAVPMVKTHEDAGESCNPEMLKFLSQELPAAADNDDEIADDGSVWDALKGLNQDN